MTDSKTTYLSKLLERDRERITLDKWADDEDLSVYELKVEAEKKRVDDEYDNYDNQE